MDDLGGSVIHVHIFSIEHACSVKFQDFVRIHNLFLVI